MIDVAEHPATTKWRIAPYLQIHDRSRLALAPRGQEHTGSWGRPWELPVERVLDALLVAVAEGIRTLQAAQAGRSMPTEPAADEAARPEAAGDLFRREGEYWKIAYEGAVVHLKDAKGLHHRARLGELEAELGKAEAFHDDPGHRPRPEHRCTRIERPSG